MSVLRITLTNGGYTLVDEEDYVSLASSPWRWKSNGYTKYVVRGKSDPVTGRCKLLLMHREIMGASPGQEVDHINHNGLDNRRRNLRICTTSQNHRNTTGKRTYAGRQPTSRFKGVIRFGGKWRAQITRNSRFRYLGLYDNEEEAARAYDIAAQADGDGFTVLNFADG